MAPQPDPFDGYTADDRPVKRGRPPRDASPSREDVLGDITPSYAALILLWTDRDVMYARRDKALTPEQITAARRFRQVEASQLPVEDRAAAYGRASTWYPPQHGQGDPL